MDHLNNKRDERGIQLIPPHGGYRDLQSYQMSEIVYDGAVVFCDRFISPRSRTHDQMVQAARSGKQNIAEGSMASGTSKKTELKLIGVARASLEELLVDFKDFLRQHGLPLWGKDHPQAKEVRGLCYKKDRSYLTYRTYFEKAEAEVAANAAILPDPPDQLPAGPAIAGLGKRVFGRRRVYRKALPPALRKKKGKGIGLI